MGAEQSTEAAEENPEAVAATKVQSIMRGRTARKRHPCVASCGVRTRRGPHTRVPLPPAAVQDWMPLSY